MPILNDLTFTLYCTPKKFYLSLLHFKIWHIYFAVVYGFKVAEKVWAVEDDNIILKNLKFRHSLLFDFEYDEFANLAVLHIAYYWGGQHIAVKGDDIEKKFLKKYPKKPD